MKKTREQHSKDITLEALRGMSTAEIQKLHASFTLPSGVSKSTNEFLKVLAETAREELANRKSVESLFGKSIDSPKGPATSVDLETGF